METLACLAGAALAGVVTGWWVARTRPPARRPDWTVAPPPHPPETTGGYPGSGDARRAKPPPPIPSASGTAPRQREREGADRG